MSLMMLAGSIPCSRLYASCVAPRRLVSPIAFVTESVIRSAYRIAVPLTLRAALPIVWTSDVALRRPKKVRR